MSKEYSNGEITVVWKPDVCIHSANCVKGLPHVFRPNKKPWIDIDAADSESLMNQINKCPSGALSYYKNAEGNEKKSNENMETEQVNTEIEVVQNGPLLVKGKVCVKHHDGSSTIKDQKTWLCRCGASGNKPYCDGSHRKIEFKG